MIRCGRRFESLPSRYLTCREGQGAVRQVGVGKDVDLGAADAFSAPYAAILLQIGASPASHSSAAYGAMDWPRRFRPGLAGNRHRSEEHTSELQSLMRISYAVFCLKKKKKSSNID